MRHCLLGHACDDTSEDAVYPHAVVNHLVDHEGSHMLFRPSSNAEKGQCAELAQHSVA